MADKIIVFTLHKSASMFLHQQCELFCQLSGIPYHSPNARHTRLDARSLLTNKAIWRNQRGCFAPIRFYVEVPDLQSYQVILHLRDPRDVLVSMFFSYCYIHVGELAANTGYRQAVAQRGIDAFVLEKATEGSGNLVGDYGTGGHVEDLIGNLPRRYRDYLDNLAGKPNVTLLKYEDMVTDYPTWLAQFARPFAIPHKDRVIAELVANRHRFFPNREQDVMTHVRHVTPGDHRNKLQPSTIKALNEIFSDTLEELGYDL